MRCKACNVALSDTEAINKDEHGYVDLCFRCIAKGAGDPPPEDDPDWENLDDQELERYLANLKDDD